MSGAAPVAEKLVAGDAHAISWGILSHSRRLLRYVRLKPAFFEAADACVAEIARRRAAAADHARLGGGVGGAGGDHPEFAMSLGISTHIGTSRLDSV